MNTNIFPYITKKGRGNDMPTYLTINPRPFRKNAKNTALYFANEA